MFKQLSIAGSDNGMTNKADAHRGGGPDGGKGGGTPIAHIAVSAKVPVPDRAVLFDSSNRPPRASPSNLCHLSSCRFLLPLVARPPDSTLGGDPPSGLCADSWGLDPALGETPGSGDCLSWTVCLLRFRSRKKASREAERANPAAAATTMPVTAPVPMPALLFEAGTAEPKGWPLP